MRIRTTAAIGAFALTGALALLTACSSGAGDGAAVTVPTAGTTAPSIVTPGSSPTPSRASDAGASPHAPGHGSTPAPTGAPSSSPAPGIRAMNASPQPSIPVIYLLAAECRESPTGMWKLWITYRAQPNNITVTVDIQPQFLNDPVQVYQGGSTGSFSVAGNYCTASLGTTVVTASTDYHGLTIQAVRSFTGTLPPPSPTGPPVAKP